MSDEFSWSMDSAEPFSGRFPSREAAVAAAIEEEKLEPGAMVWTGRCAVPDFPFRFDFEWENERAHDMLADNYDLVDQVGDWPKLDRPQMSKIEEEVVELLKQKLILLELWPPPFWTVEDTQTHFIKDSTS